MFMMWIATPTCFSQQLQLLFESIEDRGASGKYFAVSYVEQRAFQAGMFHGLKTENKNKNKKAKFCPWA